ncbi:MAG: MMPL family transporter [Chloroflexi bacterium]|nr:MMPL family transporter [Chloroflexota bacterium]
MLYRFGLLIGKARWLALILWAIALAGALLLAARAPAALAPGGFSSPDLESQRASDLLFERFGHNPATILVVFTAAASPLRNHDPRFLAAMDYAVDEIRGLHEVAAVITPRENPRQASTDGTTAYVVIALRVPPEEFRHMLPRIEGALRQSELEQVMTGAPIFYQDIELVTEEDLRRAEAISLPFAAAALTVVFGSLVAAALPIVVGGAAVVVTLAAMVVLSQAVFLSIFALNLVTMLGLGLGIDYSLFIVSRFREELRAGREVSDALARSMATAGQSVLFSGATVFVGLLVLATFPFPALRSLGLAGSLVVLASVAAALTLLPALLVLVGPAIDRLTVVRPGARTNAAWTKLADWVMAHPIRVLVPVLLLLTSLGLPFLGVRLGAPDASILPPDVPSRRGVELIQQKFGGGELTPTLVLLSAEESALSPERVGELYDVVQGIARDPQVKRVDSIVSLDPRLTREQYQLIYARPDRVTDPYARAAIGQYVRDGLVVTQVTGREGEASEASHDLVRRLRALTPPPGTQMLVGGGTAGAIDYSDGLFRDFPRAIGLLVGATYLVLLLLFGSVGLPLKAILMDLLSITASFGALVVVFQDGLLADVLGFTPMGFVEASIPIVLFCLLFGVSMDYEVFLLSRVKEAYDETGDNRRSVAEGLQRSGGVITGAAAIIVLVAGSFVTADVVLIKAIGLGAAISVLLDATLVRGLLVPATMRLLGDWNWWAPTALRRALPHWGGK